MNGKSSGVQETQQVRWVVFDAEANGLTPDKFYCLSYEDYQGRRGSLTDYEDFRSFFTEYDYYVGHNIRRWDLPNLRRVCEIEIPKNVIDTMGIAWYLEPFRKKYNLESYGDQYGIPKPVVLDWDNLSLETYIHRCERDVQINLALWKDQISYLLNLYGDFTELRKFLRYLDFKMYCLHLQEKARWKLDEERCIEAIEKLSKESEERFESLKQVMPKVPVYSKKTKPKKMYKKDGSLTSLGEAWVERLRENNLPEDYEGEIQEITSWKEPNPGSTDQLKDWLYSLGWVPETMKVLRDKVSGDMREIPQLSKKTADGNQLCPSVRKLFDKEPNLEHLDGYFMLRHRITVLEGFLRNQEDGYLTAAAAGFTNTLRLKHAEIVNLPKASNPYAEDIRACLIAGEGELLCGSDMSSLEDKLKQHFLYSYDPEYVRSLQSDTYDPHLALALLAGAVSQRQVDLYVSGEDKSIKPIRDTYKNGNYA